MSSNFQHFRYPFQINDDTRDRPSAQFSLFASRRENNPCLVGKQRSLSGSFWRRARTPRCRDPNSHFVHLQTVSCMNQCVSV